MATTKDTPHTRRLFLKRVGTTTLVLAAGGGVYRAADRGVFSTGRGAAYEPWEEWRSERADGPLALVQAAILAANPHNSQPWLFRVGERRVDLFADTRRNLGTIDPFLREMHLGLGCALENAVLSAEAVGYAPRVSLMPDPEDLTHVARIALGAGQANPSTLFHAIPERHTNRAAYDTGRVLEPDTLRAMDALDDSGEVGIRWFTRPAEREGVASLIVAATEALIADTEQLHDSDAWVRLGWDQLREHQEGITLDAQGFASLQRAMLKVLPNAVLNNSEQGARTFLQTTRDVQVATAAAFGLLLVDDAHDRRAQLRGGRVWQRLHLWATTQDLAAQPLNQLTERADRERQLGSEPTFGDALNGLADGRGQVLMPFRIGYPLQGARPSPRRTLEEVIK